MLDDQETDSFSYTSPASKRPQVYSTYIQPRQETADQRQPHNPANVTYTKQKQQVRKMEAKKPKLVEEEPPRIECEVEGVVGVETFEAADVLVLNKDFVVVRVEDLMCFKGKCSVACVYGCLGK